jgi:hypothetical protein
MIRFLLTHTRKHKMFNNIKRFLQGIFTSSSISELEQYIISKNPSNAAEVDHWAQQYNQQRGN